MITYYILNIIVFALLGTAEGFLWHYAVNKISKQTARNLHIPLVVLRAAWFAFVLFMTDKDVASVTSLFACHAFIHLGCMYQVRHMLNKRIYQYGFFDNASSTSTSVWDTLFPMNIYFRMILFALGSLAYFVWNYWI